MAKRCSQGTVKPDSARARQDNFYAVFNQKAVEGRGTSIKLADYWGEAMTIAWSHLVFATRRISEIRGGGLDPVPESYMAVDERDKVVEWAAAQNYLLTMLFCCHNLVRIDHCSTLYGNIPSGSTDSFAIRFTCPALSSC